MAIDLQVRSISYHTISYLRQTIHTIRAQTLHTLHWYRKAKPLEMYYCGFASVLISQNLSKRPFQHFSYVTFVLYYNLQVSPIFSSSRTCFDNRLRSASLSFIRVIVSKSASDVFGALPNDIYRIRDKPKYVSILFAAVQH